MTKESMMVFTPQWWRDAFVRALRTALIFVTPYLPIGVRADEVDWLTAALVAGLGFVTSLATSLKGLPETVGADVPKWQAVIIRGLKSFGQGVVTGIGTALLLTDVDWTAALLVGVTGFIGSVILGFLSHLPETGGLPEPPPGDEAAFEEIEYPDPEVVLPGERIHAEYQRDPVHGYLQPVYGAEDEPDEQ